MVFRSAWVIFEYTLVSSVKLMSLDEMVPLLISDIIIKNSSGPSTMSWVTTPKTGLIFNISNHNSIIVWAPCKLSCCMPLSTLNVDAFVNY